MKKLFTFLFIVIGLGVNAQSNFEDLVAPEEFINDSSPNAGFMFDGLFLPNNFTDCGPDCEFWDGWAISATTDTTTPGFLNQYSAFTGIGADDSHAYAVSFAFSETFVTKENDQSPDFVGIPSVHITNGTYPAISMRDGDSVAKKFGGETGDDPDFFLLTVKAYSQNELQDSIPFYLADYRFEDNSQDFILDEWVEIPFTSTTIDSITFSLSSSDNGMFGMNTPAYFCADVFGSMLITNVNDQPLTGLSLTNTLSKSELIINSILDRNANYQIFGLNAQSLKKGIINRGEQRLSVDNLPAGKYWIRVEQDGLIWTQGFIKQ